MSTKTVEKHSFQTEVQQLLHLMIHSLYSNKEIFLRELISNASDACDKLRFAALTDSQLFENEQELGIWIELDEKKKTITIRDNGIGMSRDEVVENIGTIARSGTKAFLQKMQEEEAKESNFIGQFGVGFYSSFLVSKDVTLITRRAGAPVSEGVKWHSDGSGEYTLENVEKEGRGTEIIIKLNKEDKEFAENFRVRHVISKYSDHISLPIYMQNDAPAETSQEEGEKEVQDDSQGDNWEAINQGNALWMRSKSEISKEDYDSFYTTLTYDHEAPAITLHNRVEGKLEYVSLFYIPSKAPYDLWDREQRNGIKLYVRRIFITDDAKQILPNYMRFVRGLVDCADLPLNVSREILQDNKSIDKIRAASVKKILSELKKVATKKPEQYDALWKEYGRVLKEGIIEDADNKETIAKLLRFASTHNDDAVQNVSFDDYIQRMPESQKAIYYVTADSYESAKSSPHLEVFRKNDVEVLLLSDAVDEWLVNHLTAYEETPLKSIAKGDIDLDDIKTPENKAEEEKAKDEIQPIIEKIQEALGERVKEVRVSKRLVDSPSCLVADQFDLGGNMERILQSMGQEAPVAKPILEINAEHEIVKKMSQASDVEDWANLLFDQAALAEGAQLKNPGEFVKRMNRLLVE